MITEFKMPKMGESISEATIINWLKNVGDFVNAEEILPPSTPYRTMYLDLKPLIDLFDSSTSGLDDSSTV